MSALTDKKISEVYKIGTAHYPQGSGWERILQFEHLELDDLDKIFAQLTDLLDSEGITGGEINQNGLLIEECIDLLNQRRFKLQSN